MTLTHCCHSAVLSIKVLALPQDFPGLEDILRSPLGKQRQARLMQLQAKLEDGDATPPESQMSMLERLFKEVDEDGNGSLDHDEITALCVKMGKRFTPSQMKAAIFQMDADGSGEVSYEEFENWWSHNGGLDLWALFREIDADDSGFLDMEEIGVLCRRMGKDLTPEELADAMKEMDFDGSGVVEWLEFNRWWANNGGELLKKL